MSDNNASSSSSSSKARMNELLELIEQKKATTEDFNRLIEGLPKSASERVRRRTVPRKVTPANPDPAKRAESSVSRYAGQEPGEPVSPFRTGRGEKAVKERGEENKKNANKFEEAVEFILQNSSRPLDECVESIAELEHPDRLVTLATRLIAEPGAEASIDVDKNWLQTLVQCLK